MSNKINELVALLNTVPAGQLTENAVQTYLNILNIEIVEKGNSKVSVESTSTNAADRLNKLFADVVESDVKLISRLNDIAGTTINYYSTSGTIKSGEYAGVSFMICGNERLAKTIKFS